MRENHSVSVSDRIHKLRARPDLPAVFRPFRDPLVRIFIQTYLQYFGEGAPPRTFASRRYCCIIRLRSTRGHFKEMNTEQCFISCGRGRDRLSLCRIAGAGRPNVAGQRRSIRNCQPPICDYGQLGRDRRPQLQWRVGASYPHITDSQLRMDDSPVRETDGQLRSGDWE
jgi:hypothetical protein